MSECARCQCSGEEYELKQCLDCSNSYCDCDLHTGGCVVCEDQGTGVGFKSRCDYFRKYEKRVCCDCECEVVTFCGSHQSYNYVIENGLLILDYCSYDYDTNRSSFKCQYCLQNPNSDDENSDTDEGVQTDGENSDTDEEIQTATDDLANLNL